MKYPHADLTERIIGAAMEVHRQLGPGLLESAYEVCLCRELSIEKIAHKRQVKLPVHYKGLSLEAGYRMDLVIEDSVVVELKSVEEVIGVHEAQLLTYLKLSGLRVGLLINFNTKLLKDGVTRRVL
ncbi:MAG: GxxExxY protein [Planctomycetota bacterium]